MKPLINRKNVFYFSQISAIIKRFSGTYLVLVVHYGRVTVIYFFQSELISIYFYIQMLKITVNKNVIKEPLKATERDIN